MNETKFSPRQKKILEIISQKALTRDQLRLALGDVYPVSKITLLRDLNYLLQCGAIIKSGAGNNVSYSSSERNSLLGYVDIEAYYKDQESRDKLGSIKFNFGVFNHLTDLINPQDLRDYAISDTKLSGQERKLDPTIFRREIERFVIEFSWKSSKIEGNTYSLLETEVLIKQAKEAPGHSKYEAIMILNHKNAIEYILNLRIKFKRIDVSQIIDLHKILTKDLEVSYGIRNNPVAISGTNYLPLSAKADIEKALNTYANTVNKAQNSLDKALITLACISYIQPFADGNKRTARVLANAILIAHDYYPVTFRNVEPTDYLKALLLFYEKNNLYNLKKILLEQYGFALQNYFRS